MDWDIHVDGRKYRLSNRRMLSAGIVLVILLLVAIMCVFIGIMANASDKAPVSNAQVPEATAREALDSSAALSTAQATSITTAKPVSNAQADPSLLMLVNADHPLPDGYRPETRELPNGLGIDKRAYDDLVKMIADGQREGLDFVICSAYRSYEKQQELYDNKVARVELEEGIPHEDALEVAKRTVALPGTSEHNLGLAVDIVAYAYQQLDNGQLNTPECKWLMENAWKYGFIMRYPDSKKEITHIIFEPWHYRYVGREAAKAMHESGQCLEEFTGNAE